MPRWVQPRPSRLPRNAPYDRSCPKADIHRAPTWLILKVEVPERLPSGFLHDDARVVVVRNRPRRREAALQASKNLHLHRIRPQQTSRSRRERRNSPLRSEAAVDRAEYGHRRRVRAG
jgi:hypothetical protein